MEDYRIEFSGLRARYLPGSNRICMNLYEEGEIVESEVLIDLSDYPRVPEAKVTALTQLAQAYADALNSGIDPEICSEMACQILEKSHIVPEWSDLQGFSPQGLVNLVNPINVYLFQHEDEENWVVISPDRFAEALSAEELAEYLVGVKEEQRYGGD